MSSSFCSNCKLTLPSDDSMKEHYKSEFHRYNIKRHLVNLPPITQEQFQQKKTTIVESRRAEKDTVLKCETCNKTFSSKPTYKQHMESKRHQEILASSPQKKKEITIETGEPAKPRVVLTTVNDQSICLFCNIKSENENENLVHMRLQHSFFISDLRYLKNLNGLLKYLGEKIHKGCLCIYCDNHHCKDFKSGEAVQNHMMDKGHCFMNTEDSDEYNKFYDYTRAVDFQNKMYIADDNEPLEEGEEYLEMESEDDDGNGWEDIDEEDGEEDDDEEEDGEEGDEEDVKEDGEGESRRKFRKAVGEEGGKKVTKRIHRFKVRKVKVLENGELLLPSGKIIGHRRYSHLYKQYFREGMRKTYERQNYLGESEDRTLARIDRANKLILMRKTIEAREKIRERFENAKIAIHKNYSEMKMGIRGNKLMPHFRNSNPL